MSIGSRPIQLNDEVRVAWAAARRAHQSGGKMTVAITGIEAARAVQALAALTGVEWYEVKSRGGHRQFKHSDRIGRVTVSGKLSDDMPPGTWNNVRKQAGWKDDG